MSEFWSVIWRVTVTFLLLLFLARLNGKKQISQATLFDFITAITIGDIAGEQVSNPEAPLLPWVAATCLWFGLAIGLDKLVVKNKKAATLLEGRPSVLVENGRMLEENLDRNNLRVEELLAHFRKRGYFDPADVEFAVFETDGTVSVLPRSQARNVMPRDLGLATPYEGMSYELVEEGTIVRENLRKVGLSDHWLQKELAGKGYRLEDVFFASLNTRGELFVDGYQDSDGGSPISTHLH